MIKKSNDNYQSHNNISNISNQSEYSDLPQKQSRFCSIINKLIPFAMLWGSLMLMYGVICMYTNGMGQDEFYRFIFFLRSPFVVVLNCLALLVAIFHSISWVNLVPKVIFSTRSNKRAQDYLFTIGLWLVTIAISICLVLFVLK
ncbi:hypothetical protein H3S88_01240 [Gilliamella sp. B14448G11]|uniref:hypothetical protein n=1 Tax=unclassified Gilliamella TaxID=2685620 RepID=UPI0018DB9D56|nr:MULTISPECIES: hypothetical protein [unclassified Gilliamella]MBI0027066.1 hypothetical protein [Gilliamella sp. B14448G7]MBI0034293.1 hypothetical protein [Gilliamella sp. B14448G11]MBI0042028.1 hypothetical protein [Gilliamella sp. B14448G12]